jgi:hypothetical protein
MATTKEDDDDLSLMDGVAPAAHRLVDTPIVRLVPLKDAETQG